MAQMFPSKRSRTRAIQSKNNHESVGRNQTPNKPDYATGIIAIACARATLRIFLPLENGDSRFQNQQSCVQINFDRSHLFFGLVKLHLLHECVMIFKPITTDASAGGARAKERQMKKIILSTIALLAMSGLAEAHTGHGAIGFLHGFIHPFTGYDHITAMVAVGLFAAIIGGRARYLVPLNFVAMMMAGAALALAGFQVPYVETGITASMFVLGGVVLLRWHAPVVVAMALCGFFAVFHGFAHGAEMPVEATGFEYGAGFVIATAILHAIGLATGLMMFKRPLQTA
jgi:urease accessory protein